MMIKRSKISLRQAPHKEKLMFTSNTQACANIRIFRKSSEYFRGPSACNEGFTQRLSASLRAYFTSAPCMEQSNSESFMFTKLQVSDLTVQKFQCVFCAVKYRNFIGRAYYSQLCSKLLSQTNVSQYLNKGELKAIQSIGRQCNQNWWQNFFSLQHIIRVCV